MRGRRGGLWIEFGPGLNIGPSDGHMSACKGEERLGVTFSLEAHRSWRPSPAMVP